MDKILVVDDEPDVVNLAKMILEGERYHVATASDGDGALQKAKVEVPDLILLDVVMPGKTGFEVCKILKSQAETRHVPVVMFTVLGRDVDRKLSTQAGVDSHFIKPFTPDGLLAEVKRQLDQVRGEKFSRQLGIDHGKLMGKNILLEFDPSTPYERLIRDFALECVYHGEAVVVLTKKESAVRQALEGEKVVELIDVSPDFMLSPILEKHSGQPLSVVYDSLTDLALSTNPQICYEFASSAIERLSDARTTALFLLNPAAHDRKDTYALKGLFSNQATYGKQRITNVSIV